MRGDPSMNSYNHYAYGAVADWIYRYAAGLDALSQDPGFHTILLHPHFDARLKNLSFEYETPYGTAKSKWQISGNAVNWQVTIPANSQAELGLAAAQEKTMKLDGASLETSPRIKRVDTPSGSSTLLLEAGTYNFAGQLASTQPDTQVLH
jgi:alpha-L-rhamnosidase